jgi:hypothetical protein
VASSRVPDRAAAAAARVRALRSSRSRSDIRAQTGVAVSIWHRESSSCRSMPSAVPAAATAVLDRSGTPVWESTRMNSSSTPTVGGTPDAAHGAESAELDGRTAALSSAARHPGSAAMPP